MIIQYALIESAGLFSVIAAFLTGKVLFLIITGLIVIVFAMLKPGITKIANDLNLNQEELSAIHETK